MPLEAHSRTQQGGRQPATPRVSRLSMAAMLPAMGIISRGLSSRNRVFPSDPDVPVSLRDALQAANRQRPASRPTSAQKGKRHSPETPRADASGQKPAKVQRVEPSTGSNPREKNITDRKHGVEAVRPPERQTAHTAELRGQGQTDAQGVGSRSNASAGGRAAEARSESFGLADAANAPGSLGTAAPVRAAPPGLKIRTLEEIRAERAAAASCQGNAPAALRTHAPAPAKETAAALADRPARTLRHHVPVPAPTSPTNSGAKQASAPVNRTAVGEPGRAAKPGTLDRHPESPAQGGAAAAAAAAAPTVQGDVPLPEGNVGSKRLRNAIVFSRPPSSAAESPAGVGPPIKRLAVPQEPGPDPGGAVPPVQRPAGITNGSSSYTSATPVRAGEAVSGSDKLHPAAARVAEDRDTRTAPGAALDHGGGTKAVLSAAEGGGADAAGELSSETGVQNGNGGTAGGLVGNGVAGAYMNGAAKAEKIGGAAVPRRPRPGWKAVVKPPAPEVEYEHKTMSIERAGMKLDVKYYMHVPKVWWTDAACSVP